MRCETSNLDKVIGFIKLEECASTFCEILFIIYIFSLNIWLNSLVKLVGPIVFLWECFINVQFLFNRLVCLVFLSVTVVVFSKESI